MEKILLKVLEISKESYNQEKERSNTLLTKSDYLIKYISFTFAFINALFVFLATNKAINIIIVAIAYGVISIILSISLYFAVVVQFLKQVQNYPTGNSVIKKLEKEFDKNGKMPNDTDMQNLMINYNSDYINSLQEANDKRAKLIDKAFVGYLGGIVFMSISIICIIIIIA